MEAEEAISRLEAQHAQKLQELEQQMAELEQRALAAEDDSTILNQQLRSLQVTSTR